jgi:hypothetical protein
MSTIAIIETIKTELVEANPDTLAHLLEILRTSKQKDFLPPKTTTLSPHPQRAVPAQSSRFLGENLPYEKIEKMSIKERGAMQRRLKEQNREWLQEKFTSLNALWLMIVDGEIIAWGATKKDYPKPTRIMEICQQTGKYPFIFIKDSAMAIEESSSVWNRVDANDFYPTIPLSLNSDSGSATLIADFDTGAASSFVNYDFLLAHKVVQRNTGEYIQDSVHLSQAYECISKDLTVTMTAISGEVITVETELYCVEDWARSPFVKINPKRLALIGRDLLLELKLCALLNFDRRQTQIMLSPPKRGRKKKNQKSV